MFNFNVVVFGYILPIVLTIGLLIFWRKCTTWNNASIFNHDAERKFPTRFHIFILFILSLIPGMGILVIVFLGCFYAVYRMDGAIKIKPGKHSKFWFDIDDKNE